MSVSEYHPSGPINHRSCASVLFENRRRAQIMGMSPLYIARDERWSGVERILFRIQVRLHQCEQITSILCSIPCNINVKYFPFDSHSCTILLANWHVDIRRMDLYPETAKVSSYLFNDPVCSWTCRYFSKIPSGISARSPSIEVRYPGIRSGNTGYLGLTSTLDPITTRVCDHLRMPYPDRQWNRTITANTMASTHFPYSTTRCTFNASRSSMCSIRFVASSHKFSLLLFLHRYSPHY